MTTKFNIHLLPSGINFPASEGLPILQSAFNADIFLEHGCRDGSCGVCKVRVLHGDVEQPPALGGISASDMQEGYVLTCCASPLSDIELQANYYPELNGIKPAILPCKVESLDFPVPDIAILKLRLPPNTRYRYLAGQYVDLMINGSRRSYSIASAAQIYNGIELHIKKVTNGLFSNVIFHELKINQLLRLEGPSGSFFVRDSQAPIIFLAGGTGFAPVKAMVETLLLEQSQRNIHIYWGMETSDGFYNGLGLQWQQHNNNIKYVPVVSGEIGRAHV